MKVLACIACGFIEPDGLGFNIGGVPILPCPECGDAVVYQAKAGIEYARCSPDEVLTSFDPDWDEPRLSEPKPELIEPDFMDDPDGLDDIVLSPGREMDMEQYGPVGGKWVMKLKPGQTIGWG